MRAGWLVAVAWATVLALPKSAQAIEWQLSAFATNRLNATEGQRDTLLLYDTEQRAFDTSTYLTPNPFSLYYSGFFEVGLAAEFSKAVSARLFVNTGELRQQNLSLDGTTNLSTVWTMNDRVAGDEVVATGLVRQALIDIHDPDTEWWSLRAGRKQWKIDSSLVYDDYGLGVEAAFDFDLKQGKPYRFALTYLIPSRDFNPLPIKSPFLTARFDYILSFFDSLSLSLSYFHDGDGELTEVIRDAVVERALNASSSVESPEMQQVTLYCYLNAPFVASADLFYGGLSGSKRLPQGTLQGQFVLDGGEVSVNGAPNVANACQPTTTLLSFPSFAGAFDVSYRLPLPHRLQLTTFVVGESGGIPPKPGIYYNAFLGVTPFITRTNLFFQGGLFETFGARRLTPAGVNGRGVIAPGADLTCQPLPRLFLRGVVAPLISWLPGIAKPIGGAGQFYGIELDSQVNYQLFSFLALVGEGDVLFGGNFYAQSAATWKMIGGVDLAKSWVF